MPITPAQYIREKTPVPSELRTAEWNHASAQAMERAFCMASVDNARILQAFQEQAARVAEGGTSPAEARRALRAALDAAGYQPEAGLEGTIKDLTTPRRMNVALEMNANMAAGWAERQAALQDVGFPAWELYRAVQAEHPRDWDARWNKAARDVNYAGVARNGSHVALVSSPIWTELSAFGTPHPPFDWGSGMDVMPVSFDECVELGLIDDSARPQLEQAAEAQRLESFNEDFELEPRISSAQLRARLAEDLQGIAEWDGEKLRLVDANGTRPYKWDEIGEVLTTRNHAGVPLLQLEAVAEWMTDSARFRPGRKDTVPLDMREDMARLVNRIEPIAADEGGMVSRALQFTDPAKFEAMVRRLTEPYGEEGVPLYTTRDHTIAESWNNNELTVERYTGKAYNILLRCADYESRRRVDGLYKAVKQGLINPGRKEGEKPRTISVDKQLEGLDIATEGESLFPGEVCFRVLTKKPRVYRNSHGGLVYEFEVEEYGKKKDELSAKKE